MHMTLPLPETAGQPKSLVSIVKILRARQLGRGERVSSRTAWSTAPRTPTTSKAANTTINSGATWMHESSRLLEFLRAVAPT